MRSIWPWTNANRFQRTLQSCRATELPNDRATELPNYRTTELPNYRTTELPNYRTAELPSLRHHLRDSIALDVGQSEITALESIGQLLVIDAQQLQHGRVQIVDVDRVLDHVVAEVVGLPDGDAGT